MTAERQRPQCPPSCRRGPPRLSPQALANWLGLLALLSLGVLWP